MLVDATCTPADIRYPTDLSLLNEAREKTEEIIDVLQKPLIGIEKKVRTYRNRARKEYLMVSKKRKKDKKVLRKVIRKQLSYLRRNLEYIKHLKEKTQLSSLSNRQYRDLLVISELFHQQEMMFCMGIHSIDDRIVSISQPHVRPIVRGKSGASVEFGAKLTISVVDGYVFTEKLSWDNYNEGVDLINQIENYKTRFGYYPESVHADKIYLNRANRQFCKGKNIRLSGPRLGKPPKDKEKKRHNKKLQRQDEIDRIPVEGKFGNAKRKYGLDRVMAKKKDTSESTIGLIILIMNLEKLRSSFIWVFLYIKNLSVEVRKLKYRQNQRNRKFRYDDIYPNLNVHEFCAA
ncbi:MAG: transposase [Spirochaetaceae bacterium]|nr:transposase [Spirochaetaceae bacterium]